MSLCWWAVGVGGWTNTTAFGQLMDLFFDPQKGLGLAQVRYNIGGGGAEDPVQSNYRAGGSVEAYVINSSSYL